MKCLTQCHEKGLKSLSERLAEAERGPSYGPGIPGLYRKLFEKHYGAAAPMLDEPNGAEGMRVFKWVSDFCAKHGLDEETWITAQMHGMRFFLAEQQESGGNCPYFRLWMLWGRKAGIRYNVYVNKALRRFKEAEPDTWDCLTAQERLWRLLANDEERVGAYYVRQRLADTGSHTTTWLEAVRTVDVSVEWRALKNETGITVAKTRIRLFKQHGVIALRQALQVATLRAAKAVCEQHCHGLADRIGFIAPWSWEDFAVLLRRILSKKPVHSAGIQVKAPGQEW